MNDQEIINSLRTLHDLSKTLNSTLDVEQVVNMILQRTASLMQSDKVLIFLLDTGQNTLAVHQSIGFGHSGLPSRSFSNIRSFEHCIVRKGTVITLDEVVSEEDRLFLEKNYPVLFDMFFAPLEIQGDAYGLLGVSRAKNDFSLIDLEVFCSLGSQAAVAMENASLYQQLRQTFLQTAEALAEAINSRDPYTGGHTRRVGGYCLQMGRILKFSKDDLQVLHLAAILHDIGKIGVDDAILRKGGMLTADERKKMNEHPEIAARILGHIKGMKNVIPAVRHHHEWFDGSGYPDGLQGEDIPLTARIIALADAYDALSTDRPYRKAMAKKEALKLLAEEADSHFDPALLNNFFIALECPL